MDDSYIVVSNSFSCLGDSDSSPRTLIQNVNFRSVSSEFWKRVRYLVPRDHHHPTPRPHHPTPRPYHPTPRLHHPTPRLHHPTPRPHQPTVMWKILPIMVSPISSGIHIVPLINRTNFLVCVNLKLMWKPKSKEVPPASSFLKSASKTVEQGKTRKAKRKAVRGLILGRLLKAALIPHRFAPPPKL